MKFYKYTPNKLTKKELVMLDEALKVDLTKPSICYALYWIDAESPIVYPNTSRTGKWLLWVDKPNIDEVWNKIKIATEKGLFIASKVSTAKPNPHAKNPNKHVICIYTYDYEDKEDVDRVRNELREMGFISKIPYKTDKATLAGIYGKGSSLYYE